MARGCRQATATIPHTPAMAIAAPGPVTAPSAPANAKPSACSEQARRVDRHRPREQVLGRGLPDHPVQAQRYRLHMPETTSSGSATAIGGVAANTRYGTNEAAAAAPTRRRCRRADRNVTPIRSPVMIPTGSAASHQPTSAGERAAAGDVRCRQSLRGYGERRRQPAEQHQPPQPGLPNTSRTPRKESRSSAVPSAGPAAGWLRMPNRASAAATASKAALAGTSRWREGDEQQPADRVAAKLGALHGDPHQRPPARRRPRARPSGPARPAPRFRSR